MTTVRFVKPSGGVATTCKIPVDVIVRCTSDTAGDATVCIQLPISHPCSFCRGVRLKEICKQVRLPDAGKPVDVPFRFQLCCPTMAKYVTWLYAYAQGPDGSMSTKAQKLLNIDCTG